MKRSLDDGAPEPKIDGKGSFFFMILVVDYIYLGHGIFHLSGQQIDYMFLPNQCYVARS